MPESISADFLAPAGGGFEPQRTNNWSFITSLPEGNIINLSVNGMALPNWTLNETVLNYANEQRFVASKATIATSTLTLKDFVDIGTFTAVYNWFKKVYDPTTGAIGFATQYKQTAHIILWGPDGSTERSWRLIGTWPQSLNHGNLSMAGSDNVEISVTLRFDKAIPEF